MFHCKVIIICLFIFCVNLQGQEIPKDQLASAVFDFQINRIRSNEHVAALGINQIRQNTFLADLNDEFGELLEDVDRIRGAFSLDATTEDLDAALIDKVEYPINLYFELEFRDEDLARKFSKFLIDHGFSGRLEGEDGGRPYVTPYESSGIRTYQLGAKIIVAAGRFKLGSKFESLLNDVVGEQWGELPDAPIRGAIDLVGSKKMMESFKDFLGVEFRMMGLGDAVRSVLKAFDNIDWAAGFADFDNEKLFSLTVHSEEEKLGQIEGVANGLLFLVKNGVLSQIKLMPNLSNDGQAIFRSVADQMVPERDEGGIHLEIKKPIDFDIVLRDDVIPNLRLAFIAETYRENFRAIGAAAKSFERNHGCLPFKLPGDAEFSPELSWRARVAKGVFLSRRANLNLEEGFDSESNQEYAAQMPSYFAASGSDTHSNLYWIKSDVLKSADIVDGVSNTLMVVASDKEVPWLEPDQGLSAEQVYRLVRNLDEGKFVYAGTYDGKLLTLSKDIDNAKLSALLSPAGNDN